MNKLKNRFELILRWSLLFLTLGLIFRIIIFSFDFNNFSHNFIDNVKVLLVGFFYDFLALIYWLLPLTIFLIAIPNKIYNFLLVRWINFLFWTFNVFLLLFSYVCEYLYWAEFGRRFDFIAVDYLVYTHEVWGNIEQSYPIYTIIGVLIVVSVFIVYYLFEDYIREEKKVFSFKRRFVIFLFVLFLNFIIFKFHDKYPLVDLVSKNQFNKQLAKSGIYSLFSEFRHNVMEYEMYFATIDSKQALEITRKFLKTKNSYFISLNVSKNNKDVITRIVRNKSNKELNKVNVILIMEESLSACFCGFLGDNRNLTPNLDRLAKESIIFTDLYATGTRTVRGMEAVMMSVPPTPGRSIIKRPDCDNMFTFGQIFKRLGYSLKFIYAGHGYFDNMNYFFAHNGFKIVDRKDFYGEKITHETIWGVCDEDLFRKVIKEADNDFANNKNFFYFVMTTSNHRPYTYPENRIDIKPPSKLGSVKYADWAIGYLINEAKKHDWFKNTIFIIIADHNARSAGKLELPIHRYKIPCLFYAPYIFKHRVVSKLSSQIDVLPTLFGILGITYPSKFYGNNILSNDFKERAFIGVYQRLGLILKLKDREYKRLIILDPNKKIKEYKILRQDLYSSKYLLIADSIKIVCDCEKLAVALYQSASLLYKFKLDRWDKSYEKFVKFLDRN